MTEAALKGLFKGFLEVVLKVGCLMLVAHLTSYKLTEGFIALFLVIDAILGIRMRQSREEWVSKEKHKITETL